MERYKFVNEVGRGTYGSVWQAVDKQSGEVVAIKILKRRYYSWLECLNLPEVQALRKLKHSNIVKLKEVFSEKNLLFMVFEYMECNLHQLMRGRKHCFSEAEIKNWCFQVFQGLDYMHQHGYFHRDLKPANLLINKDVIKIADLGLVKEIDSNSPYTDYVVTRWYRAPELMLRSKMYSSKVDMWAMGAIMAELFIGGPLFPGASEADEMYKICSVIGSPSEDSWADGLDLARTINYQFPHLPGVPLSLLIPKASEDAISLIRSLCSWDPCKRPTATEALQHPFFRRCWQDLINENANKNDIFLKGTARQGIYLPPGNRGGRTGCLVEDIAEKLANMVNNTTGRQCVGQQMRPPPMTAGVQWGAESNDLFLQQDSGEIMCFFERFRMYFEYKY